MPSGYSLESRRVGPLPIVNHFLKQLKIDALLDRFVPTRDRRCALAYSQALGVLLRSILVEREPIYRQQETVRTFDPRAFGLEPAAVDRLGDDTIGRALDRLFDADRGSLLTAVVVSAVRRFEVRLKELHNDSTSIRLAGQYRAAVGRSIRGRKAPWITYGHSKDHRPDLKQLLFVLTTSADGGVPVQFRCENGQVSDARTHLDTWGALREIAGKANFLYVADSKLCSGENMDTIDRQGGRFITVLPRTRREDSEFREWIQTHEPDWEEVWNRPHPRRANGPRDIWRAFRYPIPSREGWPVIWVSSVLLALHQERARRERLTRAVQKLEDLRRRLGGPKPRQRSRKQVQERVDAILSSLKIGRYLKVEVREEKESLFRQEHRGRPGPTTRYRRTLRRRLVIDWAIDETAIAYDRKSDGMYPLLTNDRTLTPGQVLEAHKRQPVIEKRFEQIKTVHQIAPVSLKNEGRIEALFYLYFIALLVQALIERELRLGMKKEGVQELAIYPEERESRRPTCQQVFRLFSLAERHALYVNGREVKIFEPKLNELQKQVLTLLGISPRAYQSVR